MKKKSICSLVVASFVISSTLVAQDVKEDKKDQSIQPSAKKEQAATSDDKKTTPTQLTSNTFKIEVTQEHAVIIDEIITTMGNSSVIGLGFKRGHLHALGKKIDGIGSLQFLGYIFSQETLKKHMVNIRKSSMKWNGFMDGIKPGLNKIEATKELYVDLPGFASSLKVATDPLVKKAEERDWNGFVSYLVKN